MGMKWRISRLSRRAGEQLWSSRSGGAMIEAFEPIQRQIV
jgi:hypothetical protein